MENLILYLARASSGIILFYLVYLVFLRKETFFRAIRWFLAGGLILATILPVLPVRYTVIGPDDGNQMNQVLNPSFINQVTAPTNRGGIGSAFSWAEVITLVYLSGVLIFFFRLVAQSLSIVYLAFKFRIKVVDGMRIVENDKYGLPFSFFNLVFINPKFHKQADLPEILAHEKVHIREYHWADLLIIELSTVVFWFNPFIWLVEHAIKQNHEYLADSGVLSRGHSIGRYQALLLNQLMGMQIVGVTNNLNFALNTKRFKMMTKKKTPKIKALRFCWALPAIAILLVAFAKPDYKASLKSNMSSIEKTENLPAQKGQVISGKVTDTNGDALPGASIVLKDSNIGTVSDINGWFKLEVPGNDDLTLVISFVGLKTAVVNVKTGNSKTGENLKIRMEKNIIGISELPVTNFKDEDKGTPPAKAGSSDEPPMILVETLPQYPGGREALDKFVHKMAQQYAQEKNLYGKARVNFTVGADGKVKDIKVAEADNEDIAKASQVIVSKMQDWKPGSQGGKKVAVDFSITMYLPPINRNKN